MSEKDAEKVCSRVAKGNIALLVTLEDRRITTPPTSTEENSYRGPHHGGHLLTVTNTHIVASTAATDVKILQSYMLLRFLEKSYSHLPLLVCGDFNSTPDSAVYQLWSTGSISPSHPDLFQMLELWSNPEALSRKGPSNMQSIGNGEWGRGDRDRIYHYFHTQITIS